MTVGKTGLEYLAYFYRLFLIHMTVGKTGLEYLAYFYRLFLIQIWRSAKPG